MPFRRRFDDEVVEKFENDSDAIDAIRLWARQTLLNGRQERYDEELTSRLYYLLTLIDSIPEEYEREPVEVA